MKTAKEYLNSPASEQFKRICEQADTEPTKRQVRKFIQRRGKAYKANTDKTFNVNLG